MSKKKKPIDNAQKVIERFGGIRPMAKTIDVAVTTVQGWKKRDKIPGTRRANIIKAAEAEGIDLSDLLEDVQAPDQSVEQNVSQSQENESVQPAEDIVENIEPDSQENTHEDEKNAEEVLEEDSLNDEAEEDVSHTPPVKRSEEPMPLIDPTTTRSVLDDLSEKLAETEKKAIAKSFWINLLLIVCIIGGLFYVFWPKISERIGDETLNLMRQDIQSIKADMDSVKEYQSFLSTRIPDDLDERIQRMQDETPENYEETVVPEDGIQDDAASEPVTESVEDNASEESDAGEVEEAEEQEEAEAETLIEDETASVTFADAKTYIENQSGSASLGRLTEQFLEVFSLNKTNEEPSDPSGDALEEMDNDTSVRFSDMEQETLQQVGLYVGLQDLANRLNENKKSFTQSLILSRGLLPEGNRSLSSAFSDIEKYAAEGVTQVPELKEDFSLIEEEIKKENGSETEDELTRKIKERFNEILRVEKDGEVLNGNQFDVILGKANDALDEGDIESTIKELNNLDDAEKEKFSDWIEKARSYLDTQQAIKPIKMMIEAIESNNS